MEEKSSWRRSFWDFFEDGLIKCLRCVHSIFRKMVEMSFWDKLRVVFKDLKTHWTSSHQTKLH